MKPQNFIGTALCLCLCPGIALASAWRCTEGFVNPQPNIASLPAIATMDVDGAQQSMVMLRLTDTDNSITLIEWAFEGKLEGSWGPEPIQVCEIDTVTGVTTCAPWTMEWDPATQGKEIVLSLPTAYLQMELRFTAITGTVNGTDALLVIFTTCSL